MSDLKRHNRVPLSAALETGIRRVEESSRRFRRFAGGVRVLGAGGRVNNDSCARLGASKRLMWVDAEDQNASLRHKNEAGALQKWLKSLSLARLHAYSKRDCLDLSPEKDRGRVIAEAPRG
jgi:hypothetical protein